MPLIDPYNNQIGPPGLGSNIYENDWFCLAENTPILRKDPSGRIELVYVQELKDNDFLLSINKKKEQEWKRIKIERHLAPDKLIEIRAQNLIQITDNHKLFKDNFEIEKASFLKKEEKLLSVSKLDINNSRNYINFTDVIKETPTWLIQKPDYIGHNGGFPKTGERLIKNKLPLNYDTGCMFGLYLAEGSLEKNLIQFAFNKDENELSEFLEKVVFELFEIKPTVKILPQYGRRIVHIYHKTLWYLMSSLFPGLANKKEIPYWCFDANDDFKLGLINGWIFGDGTFGDRAGHATSVSKKLVYGMHNIALSMGISTSICRYKSKFENHQERFDLIYSSKETFEKLFKENCFWKHYLEVKKYCSLKNTKKGFTKSQLEQLFLENYKPGMTQKEFVASIKIGWGPFRRIYKTWRSLLEEYNKDSYNKRQFISKKELVLFAINWLKDNKFSEPKWIKDKTCPSIGWIRKYFHTSKSFINYINSLSHNDIKLLQVNIFNNENNYIDSSKITKIETIVYLEKYVYDIVVEDNENFLLGNIVSHNSGSQINVMFGDILVDCAVAINYTRQQSKSPIYGYASQYYSFTSAGHIIGMGTLTVAFKESGYLMYPIQRFVNNSGQIDVVEAHEEWASKYPELWQSPRYGINKNGNVTNFYTPTDYSLTEAARAAERKKVYEGNIEQSFTSTTKDKQRFWRELASLPDDAFEDYAETFEDAVWYGSDRANTLVRDKFYARNILQGTNISNEDVLQHRSPDLYPPIDILIIYGDMSRQPNNHTVVKLLDVEFTDKSQSIEANGQPIYEQYSFICRNII